MAYFIDLFSPETYEAFARSPRDISGFGLYHKNKAGAPLLRVVQGWGS